MVGTKIQSDGNSDAGGFPGRWLHIHNVVKITAEAF